MDGMINALIAAKSGFGEIFNSGKILKAVHVKIGVWTALLSDELRNLEE